MRALQARESKCREEGSLSPKDETAIHSALIRFKSLFPNASIKKHEPVDVILSPQADLNNTRKLMIWGLGTVESDWVAAEFFRSYFAGDGISPPLKNETRKYLEEYHVIRN